MSWAAPYGGGVVYFITDGDLIKIGVTGGNAKYRMRGIRHDKPLRVLAEVPGDEDYESQLHTRFHHLRVRGEWFRDDPELRAFITSLTDAKDGRCSLCNGPVPAGEMCPYRHINFLQRDPKWTAEETHFNRLHLRKYQEDVWRKSGRYTPSEIATMLREWDRTIAA